MGVLIGVLMGVCTDTFVDRVIPYVFLVMGYRFGWLTPQRPSQYDAAAMQFASV